jgi:hypothetical protein
VKRKLSAATTADEAEATRLLRAVRDDLRRLRDADPNADLDDLEARVDQRLREVSERDAYERTDDLGGASNPDDEDAP